MTEMEALTAEPMVDTALDQSIMTQREDVWCEMERVVTV